MDDYIAVLVVVVLASIRRTYISYSYWSILYTLPGVVLHEVSHYIIALITNGKPTDFTIIPRKLKIEGKKYYVLGSVKARTNPFNAFLIGTAPLIVLLPSSFLIYRNWFNFFPEEIGYKILLYAILYLFLYNAVPSKQDIRVAFSYKTGIFVPILILLLILFV